ncbi:uncharacterized protein LOC141543723 [Sminthopsis crassicaudata]|uniref:uncharacterized protein LOC141543723 n=1 Tax=Sminthopsis crassicaudata TaxID=9301 RepID=UPI003D683171
MCGDRVWGVSEIFFFFSSQENDGVLTSRDAEVPRFSVEEMDPGPAGDSVREPWRERGSHKQTPSRSPHTRCRAMEREPVGDKRWPRSERSQFGWKDGARRSARRLLAVDAAASASQELPQLRPGFSGSSPTSLREEFPFMPPSAPFALLRPPHPPRAPFYSWSLLQNRIRGFLYSGAVSLNVVPILSPPQLRGSTLALELAPSPA